MKRCLAIDIGASSGRHIVGWMENGTIQTEEVYRFPNGVVKQDGHLIWDVQALFESVLEGISETFRKYPDVSSLSVDTWGVDYVLLQDGVERLPAHAYRDTRTEKAIERTHQKVPFERLYSRTGCQFQTFTTIYQLMDDLERGRLDGVTDMLMMPEYIMYKLTGVKAREYTEATTTGLVSAATGEFDMELIADLGLPTHLFPALSAPGTVLGELLPEVAARVGGNCRVVLCATHDTASAVEGIPMEEDAPYISSGTWSLLGRKTKAPITDEASRAANYSNEGGVGYNRYQKNIMGMWLISELRRHLCPDLPYDEVARLAQESTCDVLVDANAEGFFSPENMVTAFDAATNGALKTPGDYFRCAYRSLATGYKQALEELERNTGLANDRLYIVGGGAKNEFMNRLTRQLAGVNVTALPIEATALGNLKVQMEAVGD